MNNMLKKTFLILLIVSAGYDLIGQDTPVEENDFSKYDIFYSSNESGNFEIYIADIEGGNQIANNRL